MELAVEELNRSLRYHTKQLEENLQSIRSKEEAIEALRAANVKESYIIEQIIRAINLIKMDMDLLQSIPTEKQPTDSIPRSDSE